ncbi:hypothetical protein [Streptomyces sp. NBC_00503]|uniref:hypothetical protein n=1 Tax=Streptomyces sp. NBC_00503 TaxID=2903659 RepID=UPI002E81357C|nr:hypothetical protein [Streptomyces sp. NBC_00503]WUD85315.1 hypothetical protein OG490_34750 [Streptomyces sp. NBC_00503]
MPVTGPSEISPLDSPDAMAPAGHCSHAAVAGVRELRYASAVEVHAVAAVA